MLSGYKNLPLNIHGTIKAVDLIETAGKNILIKIGEVIGTQAQMYQENKRKMRVKRSGKINYGVKILLKCFLRCFQRLNGITLFLPD